MHRWKSKGLVVIFLFISQLGWAQSRPIQISQQLLYAIYTRQNTQSFTEELAAYSINDLSLLLNADSLKKAFWINIYNAAVQLTLKDSADRANEKVFFNRKVLSIAGQSLSLNDIEHGMLRISKSGKGKKKRNKWIVSTFEKQLRLSQPDWRIFFALNTGVESDPYIAFHSDEGIQRELDQKMRQYVPGYLNSDTLQLNCRFSWYLRDAGGEEKLIGYFQNNHWTVHDIMIQCDRSLKFKPRYFIGSK